MKRAGSQCGLLGPAGPAKPALPSAGVPGGMKKSVEKGEFPQSRVYNLQTYLGFSRVFVKSTRVPSHIQHSRTGMDVVNRFLARCVRNTTTCCLICAAAGKEDHDKGDVVKEGRATETFATWPSNH